MNKELRIEIPIYMIWEVKRKSLVVAFLSFLFGGVLHGQVKLSKVEPVGYITQDIFAHSYDSLEVNSDYPPLLKCCEKEFLQITHLRDLYFTPYSKENYSIIKLDLLYRPVKYPSIKYKSTNISKSKVRAYNDFITAQKLSKKLSKELEVGDPLREAQNHFIYFSPEFVVNSWDSVPDAPDITTRGFLKKKSAHDDLAKVLGKYTYETEPTLTKFVEVKSPWTLEGTENVQLSQLMLNKFWKEGGEESVSLSSDLRLKLTYNRYLYAWESYVIHKLGAISTTIDDQDVQKVNDDMLEFNTKFGRQAHERWFYSFLCNFKSQLFRVSEEAEGEERIPVSGFMAPGYMTFALGMDYKKGKDYTVLLSPYTSKLTIVGDTATYGSGKYGIPEKKRVDVLHGMSLSGNITHQFNHQLKVTSKIDAFYQLFNKQVKKQTHVDWEVIVEMKLNRFFTTRLLGHLRYYTNESYELKIKENFNIAFSYNF